MSNPVNLRRRRLLGTTIASIGVLDLGLAELVHAQPAPSSNAGTLLAGQANPFGTLQQIDAACSTSATQTWGRRTAP